MPFCSNCGSETKESQKFCSECGHILPKSEETKASVSFDSFQNLRNRLMMPVKAKQPDYHLLKNGILCILAISVGLFMIYIGYILFNDSPFQGKWYDEDGQVVLEFLNKTELRTGEGRDQVTIAYKQLENNHFLVNTVSGEMEFWIESEAGDALLNCTLYEAFGMGPVRIYRRGKIPRAPIGPEKYSGLFPETATHENAF